MRRDGSDRLSLGFSRPFRVAALVALVAVPVVVSFAWLPFDSGLIWMAVALFFVVTLPCSMILCGSVVIYADGVRVEHFNTVMLPWDSFDYVLIGEPDWWGTDQRAFGPAEFVKVGTEPRFLDAFLVMWQVGVL